MAMTTGVTSWVTGGGAPAPRRPGAPPRGGPPPPPAGGCAATRLRRAPRLKGGVPPSERNALGRRARAGVAALRDAARQVGLAPGLDTFLDRLGHQRWILRERDRAVDQDCVGAKLHRERRVGRGAYAGVDDDRHARLLDDDPDLLEGLDALAGN